MKLSREESKAHNMAQALVNQEAPLTYEEKVFVLENYHEGAEHMNGVHGAFFTPFGLARDFAIELSEDKTIDLCAGIGMLAFVAVHFAEVKEITCIEVNPNYVKVGKKIVPEANWICGSILDYEVIQSLDKHYQAISNPPFGNIVRVGKKPGLKYSGYDFEFITIEIASKISKKGFFIVPQTSTPFKYSGNAHKQLSESNKYKKFFDQTGFEMEFGCGIDTGYYINDWKGVKPMCEVVHVDFTNKQPTLF